MEPSQRGKPTSKPHAVPRRNWLGFFLIGGTLTALGGAVALLRSGGYVVAPDRLKNLRVLEPWQFVVVSGVARRIVAPDRPQGVPTPDEVGVAEFVDGYLLEMPPALRRDFLRLLRYLEDLAPFASGYTGRFAVLSPAAQDDVLAALEASRFDQLRAGFQALKSIVMMGYYRDPRTFSMLGYGGPFVMDRAERTP
jgi:hypothetical protein